MKTLKLIILSLLVTTTMTVIAESEAGDKGAIADANNPAVLRAFEDDFDDVVKVIQATPDFKPIPLKKKKDQSWFSAQAFKLWNNEISKQTFIEEGVKRFPKNRESFEFLANEIRN